MRYALFLIFTGVFLVSCMRTSPSEKEIALANAARREGEIFLYQQEYTAALARLLAADKILPHDPDLLNSLGLAYLGKGENELARKTFSRALTIRPDYREAANNLGAACLRLEQWDEAIAIFQHLINDLLYTTPHYALANMGWAYLGKKEFSRAHYFFEKSLALEPDFVAGSHGIIQTLFQAGSHEKALEYANSCLERFPETPVYHADLAQMYEAAGQHEKARHAWEKVKKFAPPRSKLAAKARRYLCK